MALVLASPVASPNRPRSERVQKVKRIILVGLGKEITAVRKTSTAENPARTILAVAKSRKGYLQLDPSIVDKYYNLLEECFITFMPDLPDQLNISIWRDGFIECDNDTKREITKCDQPMWLSTWGRGEAEKASAVWQYGKAAVTRKGISRSLSLIRLKMLVTSYEPGAAGLGRSDSQSTSPEVQLVADDRHADDDDDDDEVVIMEFPANSGTGASAEGSQQNTLQRLDSLDSLEQFGFTEGSEGLEGLMEGLEGLDEFEEMSNDDWPVCPFDDLEEAGQCQMEGMTFSPIDLLTESETEALGTDTKSGPENQLLQIVQQSANEQIHDPSQTLGRKNAQLGKANGKRHEKGRGRGRGRGRGKGNRNGIENAKEATKSGKGDNPKGTKDVKVVGSKGTKLAKKDDKARRQSKATKKVRSKVDKSKGKSIVEDEIPEGELGVSRNKILMKRPASTFAKESSRKDIAMPAAEDPKDSEVIKQWHAWSGDNSPHANPENVKIRQFSEYGKAMLQVRDCATTICTLSVHHYGEDRTMKLCIFVKSLYLRGFTKNQINKLKMSLTRIPKEASTPA